MCRRFQLGKTYTIWMRKGCSWVVAGRVMGRSTSTLVKIGATTRFGVQSWNL
ncbi:hypothetical protein B0H34DRAFT_730300 [Crassisporium funariophilum]|nr:hypothetical protein B0H34DRAFT_730300 [Crassisporium funariophilum]